MKTNINIPISSAKEAKEYINSLHQNRELYHFEDNASETIWNTCKPTKEEIKQLDLNRDKVFKVMPDTFGYMLELINK